MSGQDDLQSSLKAIMAARREGLGEPPTPEELLAYRDGRLSPPERDRMEDRLAVWPDAARTLADIAAFPNVEPAPGTPELSDDDITARWQSFRQRLPDRAMSTVQEEASVRAVSPMKLAPAAPAARRDPALRLAAAALVGLAVGWGAGSMGRDGRDSHGSAINTTIAELAPAGGGARSAPSLVEMGEGSEELLLILGLDGREEQDFSGYEAEAIDAAGQRVWSRDGLRPTPRGTFHLSFQLGALKPGPYRIDLYGRDGEVRKLLGTYHLRLLEGATAVTGP